MERETIERIKDDIFYEELLTNEGTDSLIDAGFTDEEEVCDAIECLYLSLPMRDGRKPAAGLERVERKAWNVILAVMNTATCSQCKRVCNDANPYFFEWQICLACVLIGEWEYVF
jgi:hypothetical protein